MAKRESRYVTTCLRVAALVERGLVLTAYSALASAEVTAGPFHEACGNRRLFACIQHGGTPRGSLLLQLEGGTFVSSDRAAVVRCFVDAVGTGRAREACIVAERKADAA